MTVLIPSPLFSYTGGEARLEARGENLQQVLDDLDGRFPGIRFRLVDEQDRIREHIRFFVHGAEAKQLTHALNDDAEIMIVAALSGGGTRRNGSLGWMDPSHPATPRLQTRRPTRSRGTCSYETSATSRR